MERIKASRGPKLRCKGWRQEAILRMLENNLENAEKPDQLIIYGGTGTAARCRSPEAFRWLGGGPARRDRRNGWHGRRRARRGEDERGRLPRCRGRRSAHPPPRGEQVLRPARLRSR